MDLVKNKPGNKNLNFKKCFKLKSYRFQDWISLGTLALDIDDASEKIRPSADVSGMVRRALRKLAL